MTGISGQVKWLRRRYGFSVVPLIVINSIILYAILIRFEKFGADSARTFFVDAFGAILIFNIIPLIALYDIWIYRLGYNSHAIFARPLVKFGPCNEMRIDDIDVVDLKVRSDLISGANATLNPSVIVLYRKSWDGEEIFALDPRRTNLWQFKELVRIIHDRRPETFTENALRYLNSSNLITPRGASDGSFIL